MPFHEAFQTMRDSSCPKWQRDRAARYVLADLHSPVEFRDEAIFHLLGV